MFIVYTDIPVVIKMQLLKKNAVTDSGWELVAQRTILELYIIAFLLLTVQVTVSWALGPWASFAVQD